MRREPQTDNQALVTEDALIIAEDGVCKLRMKARDGLQLLFVWLD
jgi:hypothetical protein